MMSAGDRWKSKQLIDGHLMGRTWVGGLGLGDLGLAGLVLGRRLANGDRIGVAIAGGTWVGGLGLRGIRGGGTIVAGARAGEAEVGWTICWWVACRSLI